MSLLNPADTQHYFDVIDGWGGNLGEGGALDDSIKPAAVHQYSANGGTSPLKRGAIVMATHDGTDRTVSIPLLDTVVALDAHKRAQKRFWMVVEGNTEYEYSSHFGSQKVVCLRGVFTVETAHVKGTLNIGDAVMAENDAAATVGSALPHQLVSGSPGINEGRLALLAGAAVPLGFVTDKKQINGINVYTIEMNLA